MTGRGCSTSCSRFNAVSATSTTSTIDAIADELAIPRVDVAGRGVLLLLPRRPAEGPGRDPPVNDVIDRMTGVERVWPRVSKRSSASASARPRADGRFTLEWTSCIGMSRPGAGRADQRRGGARTSAPARRAAWCASSARTRTARPAPVLVREYGDGNNAHDLVRSMVKNNIRQRRRGDLRRVATGDAGLAQGAGDEPGRGDPRGQDRAPARPRRRRLPDRHEVGVRPRGRRATERYVVCNADEGEPGTFKDRVILTERPTCCSRA